MGRGENIEHFKVQAYTSVSQVVVRLVDEIMGQREEMTAGENQSKKQKEGKWQIYLTGHSMGAALCCLSAFQLSVNPQIGCLL